MNNPNKRYRCKYFCGDTFNPVFKILKLAENEEQ